MPDLFFTTYYDFGLLGAVPKASCWKGYCRTKELKMTGK